MNKYIARNLITKKNLYINNSSKYVEKILILNNRKKIEKLKT